jgi:hypothetical protein
MVFCKIRQEFHRWKAKSLLVLLTKKLVLESGLEVTQKTGSGFRHSKDRIRTPPHIGHFFRDRNSNGLGQTTAVYSME